MNENCGFQGNGDLYGLGVQLGLYIQLLSLGIVFSLLPKSLYSSYFINTNISLFASTWIIIITESALTSAYWTWLFLCGLDVLPRSACPDEYAFFFARVSLYHWFRTLSKVFYVIALVSAVYECRRLPKQIMAIPVFSTVDPLVQMLLAEMEEDRTFQLGYIAFSIVNTLLIRAVGVLSTELTIKWNNIQGVYTLNSVGQLVPFIMGLGLLMNVTYQILKKYRVCHHQPEIEESSGDGSGIGK